MRSSPFFGRSRESADLERALRARGPALAVITGERGTGKSALLRRVTEGRHAIRYTATALPLHAHLPRLAEALARAAGRELGEAPASWSGVLATALEGLDSGGRGRLIVLDDVHRLCGDREFRVALGGFWSEVRRHGLPVFLLLAGLPRSGLTDLVGPDGDLAGAPSLACHLEDLGPREVAAELGEWTPTDRLLAWAVFGGRPARLRYVDPAVRLATNVQRLILEPEGPLHRDAPDELARMFQRPERYAGIVHALARGEREWGEIQAALADPDGGRRLAPYLATLEERGLVRAARSLDARPGSRRRRYRLRDPHLAFWYRCVLPELGGPGGGGHPDGSLKDMRRSCLERHAASVFPAACRRSMAGAGLPHLPGGTRQVGALWGAGYELPVSGTLRSGVPFYGVCVWGRRADEDDADRVTTSTYRTRFGFGREARLRLIFAAGAVTEELRRRAAREDLLRVLTLDELLGG